MPCALVVLFEDLNALLAQKMSWQVVKVMLYSSPLPYVYALLSSSALANNAKAQKHPANIRANMQQSSRDAMHIRTTHLVAGAGCHALSVVIVRYMMDASFVVGRNLGGWPKCCHRCPGCSKGCEVDVCSSCLWATTWGMFSGPLDSLRFARSTELQGRTEKTILKRKFKKQNFYPRLRLYL